MPAVFLCVVVFLLYTAQAFADKQSSRIANTDNQVMLFGVVKCGLSALFALIFLLCSFHIGEVNVHTVWISVLAGIGQGVCTYLLVITLKQCMMVQVNLFMSVGVLVPTIMSMILYNEPLSLLRWGAIGLFLISAALLLGIKKWEDFKMNGKACGLLLLLSLFFGLIMFAQKSYPKMVPSGNVSLFSLLMYCTSTLLLSIGFFATRKKAENMPKNSKGKKFFLTAVVCAVIVFLLNQSITLLSGQLSAALAFTLTNGAKLLLVVLVSVLYYKEKLTWRSMTGMLLMFISVFILSV